jgi:CRISPR system Cascade subunit CasA
MHPLTPYSLDAKGEKPPISSKGRLAGRGYRDWVGLVLGNDDHQPDAARVMAHFTAKVNRPRVRLWCFGFDMSNMKALCWYDSILPVHVIEPDLQRAFAKSVKRVLDAADSMAKTLHQQVKAAWFRRPGDAGAEPAVTQSFWQGSEVAFYRLLDELSVLDFDSEAELAPAYRRWLLETRRLALALFDHWVLSGPLEDQDMRRIVKARADLGKELSSGKACKPLWEIINRHHEEPA